KEDEAEDNTDQRAYWADLAMSGGFRSIGVVLSHLSNRPHCPSRAPRPLPTIRSGEVGRQRIGDCLSDRLSRDAQPAVRSPRRPRSRWEESHRATASLAETA